MFFESQARHCPSASRHVRMSPFMCLCLCVYIICSSTAMYLLCVCTCHFSAFQAIHFPALEAIHFPALKKKNELHRLYTWDSPSSGKVARLIHHHFPAPPESLCGSRWFPRSDGTLVNITPMNTIVRYIGHKPKWNWSYKTNVADYGALHCMIYPMKFLRGSKILVTNLQRGHTL